MQIRVYVWVRYWSNLLGPAVVLSMVGWDNNYAYVRFECGKKDVLPLSWLEDICQECLMPNCDC